MPLSVTGYSEVGVIGIFYRKLGNNNLQIGFSQQFPFTSKWLKKSTPGVSRELKQKFVRRCKYKMRFLGMQVFFLKIYPHRY